MTIKLTPYRSQLRHLATLLFVFAVLNHAAAAQSEATNLKDPAQLQLGSLPFNGGDVVYKPGAGLRLGDTGLSLGGYSRVDLSRDEGGPARLAIEDLSLFTIWDPVPRFRVFSELEAEDAAHVDDHGRGGTSEHKFTLERLYGDVAFSDRVNLRVGKFLTPIGRWNLIHAAPLVWTTSRPLVTIVPFATHTTGVMLFGNLDTNGSITYSAFGQFVDSFETSSEELNPADRSAGFRLELSPSSTWAIGTTYTGANRHSAWNHLGGADALWRKQPVEIMS